MGKWGVVFTLMLRQRSNRGGAQLCPKGKKGRGEWEKVKSKKEEGASLLKAGTTWWAVEPGGIQGVSRHKVERKCVESDSGESKKE